MFLEVLPQVSGGVTSRFWRYYLMFLDVIPVPHVSGCVTSCFWREVLPHVSGGAA